MNAAGSGRPRRVLLVVEDSPSDVRLVKECLRESEAFLEPNVVNNGAEAMAFLRREGTYAGAPRPDLILLDLNLPGMSGREVLARSKADDDLRRIPVVVLTSSDAYEDIAACYDLGANCYVTKPICLDEFARVIQTLAKFWLTAARLPEE